LHFLQIAKRKSLIHGKHCTFAKVFNKIPSIQQNIWINFRS
jgi:hypothetical protein